MKVSINALMHIAAINCAFKPLLAASNDVALDSIPTQNLQARVAFVTEDSVQEARALAETDPRFALKANDPDVKFGSLVTIVKDADGRVSGKVWDPGASAPVVLERGGREISFTGEGMFAARQILIHMQNETPDVPLDQDAARLQGALQSVFEMVSNSADADRFPASLLAQAFHARITDTFGEVDIPVSEDDFVAKIRVDMFRALIADIDPNHPDALGKSQSLMGILEDAGVEIVGSGTGSQARAQAQIQIKDDAMRAALKANDYLCRKVFGAMTTTSIEHLSVAMVSIADIEGLKQSLADDELTGDWVDEVKSRVGEFTRAGAQGYRFEMSVYSTEGEDILLVTDTPGRAKGVGFVYAWPTVDRCPLMDVGQGNVLAISPQDVPSNAELQRLRLVVDALEAKPPMGEFETADVGGFRH